MLSVSDHIHCGAVLTQSLFSWDTQNRHPIAHPRGLLYDKFASWVYIELLFLYAYCILSILLQTYSKSLQKLYTRDIKEFMEAAKQRIAPRLERRGKTYTWTLLSAPVCKLFSLFQDDHAKSSNKVYFHLLYQYDGVIIKILRLNAFYVSNLLSLMSQLDQMLHELFIYTILVFSFRKRHHRLGTNPIKEFQIS